MNHDIKLVRALARHRDATSAVPRLQLMLANAEKEHMDSAAELIRIVKSLGKVGKQLVFAGEIYRVVELEAIPCSNETYHLAQTGEVTFECDCSDPTKAALMLERQQSNVEWIDEPK